MGLPRAVFAYGSSWTFNRYYNFIRLGPAASFVDSTTYEIQRDAAQTRLLVFRLHVGVGLAYGGDDAVQRHAVRPVAVQRQRRRGDPLDRAEGLRLARHLPFHCIQ
jgi:hypothetical protein